MPEKSPPERSDSGPENVKAAGGCQESRGLEAVRGAAAVYCGNWLPVFRYPLPEDESGQDQRMDAWHTVGAIGSEHLPRRVS